MLFTMGLQMVTRGPIMAIWAIGKISKSEYWLWAVVVAVIECLDDHRSHDSGLSKTIGHPKIDR